MAKKKQAEALRELDTIKQAADLSADDQLRYIRDIECKLTQARASKRATTRKLAQAEADLVQTEDKLEAMLHLNSKAASRKYTAPKKRRGRGQATAIVCVNDWHAEQTVESSLVGGINEFNRQIADTRITRVWDQSLFLIDFARKICNIDEIVLWAGGDLMNGMIHEEFQQTNWAGPTDAAVYVQNHLITGIDTLLRGSGCKNLRFMANHGNHGRSTEKKRPHTQHAHSWERLIYSNVASYYDSNKKVRAYIEPGPVLHTEIQGHICRFSHGDTIKYMGGQAGIMGPASKAIQAWNQQHGVAELTVIGHFHQFLTTTNFVACGCLIGFDPYAQYIRAKAEAPTQTLIIMDREHGKTLTFQIFCESKPNAQKQWSTPEFHG